MDEHGDFDEAALEAGRRLFAGECRFLLGVARLDQLPAARLPEIAFAGRSNVGKSSLLNALTGRKALARTSNTPGRTREINYFALGERLVLVDLPGYGYAKAPKRMVAAWQKLLRAFLRGRQPLRRVLLLIDARHGIKPPDREMMTMLDETAVIYQAVLTKADKLGPDQLAALLEATAAELASRPAAHPRIIATSAVTGAGIAELRAELAALADAA
jgi:GTP-binding protein